MSRCKRESECTMQPWCRITQQCYRDTRPSKSEQQDNAAGQAEAIVSREVDADALPAPAAPPGVADVERILGSSTSAATIRDSTSEATPPGQQCGICGETQPFDKCAGKEGENERCGYISQLERWLSNMQRCYADACGRVVGMGIPSFGTLNEGLDKLKASRDAAQQSLIEMQGNYEAAEVMRERAEAALRDRDGFAESCRMQDERIARLVSANVASDRNALRWQTCLRLRCFPTRLGSPLYKDGGYVLWTMNGEHYGGTENECVDAAIDGGAKRDGQ